MVDKPVTTYRKYHMGKGDEGLGLKPGTGSARSRQANTLDVP